MLLPAGQLETWGVQITLRGTQEGEKGVSVVMQEYGMARGCWPHRRRHFLTRTYRSAEAGTMARSRSGSSRRYTRHRLPYQPQPHQTTRASHN